MTASGWRRLVLPWLLLVAIGWPPLWAASPASADAVKAADVTIAAADIGGDFTLTDHDGQPFQLSEQRGKVVVLFFGFTHCPAVCPDSLSKMAYVLRELAAQADQVSALFISVDPERDTPAKLAEYVPFFSPELIGLTGSKAQIDQVTAQYRAHYQLNKNSADDSGYTVDHSADIYVLDRAGKLNSIIPYGLPAQHVLQVVKQVLAEPYAGATEAAPPEPLAASVVAEVANAGSATESYTLTDLHGQAMRLAQWRGKPLLINFWATWCPPCRKEIPALNRAWQQLEAEGIQMLAVNVGESRAAVSAFVQDYPIEFPLWLDERGDSMARWQIKGMPTTVLLNVQGEVVWQIAGEREWDSAVMLAKIRGD